MDINLKNCKHNKNQKAQTNSQKSKQNSLKSRDSGLSPEPSYEKSSNENSEYMIHALNSDMIEMRSRLQKAELEKEELKLQIHKLFEEKKNFEKHLEAISSAHDSRITEMHCVIVELKNRLRTQQDAAIIEETEPEGSELSFQEGSVYNSEMSNCNYDRPEIESNEQKIKIIDHGVQRPKVQNIIQKSSPSLPTPHYSSQIECLQEEVLQLRAQIALLQSEIACRDCSIDKMTHDSNIDKEPGDNGKSNYTSDDDLCDTADIYDVAKDQKLISHHQLNELSKLAIVDQQNQCDIPKIAERVKLKRTMEENFISNLDIASKDTLTTEMAEHLVSNFMQVDNNLASSPNTYQNEITRLQRRVEHLKLQNTVLSFTLSESKQHCDKLYLLCGKYESNAVALQQALNCNDRSIEAYDCLLALLESKLAVLENFEYADENRRAAVSVAYTLLERLKKENSFYGKSTAPWQEAVVILPENENVCWSEEHDRMLRNQVSKLKGQRALIQNTAVDLESPFNADEHDFSIKFQLNKAHQKSFDIEQAILMQELVSLRGELSDLKHKTDKSEKEKIIANEKLKSLQAALVQLQSQLNESESRPKDRFSYSELEYNASIERELVEALSRECRLKTRLQGLAESLETATKGNANCSTKSNVNTIS